MLGGKYAAMSYCVSVVEYLFSLEVRAMATQSKPAFDRNIERARYFLQIHAQAQVGAGAPPLPYRELPRAAIVFSVGAIDAYLSEVSAEVIVRQLQTGVANNTARDVLKRVQQDIPTLALEVAVLATAPERLQRIREMKGAIQISLVPESGWTHPIHGEWVAPSNPQSATSELVRRSCGRSLPSTQTG